MPPNPYPRLTRALIMDKRSPAAKEAGVGSWTKAQLQEWGVSYPPTEGWIERLLAEATLPRSCGSDCDVERVVEAAIRALSKAGALSEDQALELLAKELSA